MNLPLLQNTTLEVHGALHGHSFSYQRRKSFLLHVQKSNSEKLSSKFCPDYQKGFTLPLCLNFHEEKLEHFSIFYHKLTMVEKV